MSPTLRTPDERFQNLSGFDFAAHYVQVGEGLRIHYLDEGAGPAVLLMHGEPSWSYLYRTMIPPLVGAGFRVVAPDLVGFGRSDKPSETAAHTYAAHVQWMLEWIRGVDVGGATLFGQDWGGLIGLRMVTSEPDRFVRVAVANTGLPTGDHDPGDAFRSWQGYAASVPEFPVGRIVQGATVTDLPADVVAGYEAPFPDETYKAGPRVMPSLVPTTPDDPESEANRSAWKILSEWRKPLLTLFSDSDPITAGGERPFRKLVPGAAGQPHTTIDQAGHFLQEDRGPEIARRLIEWMT